MRWKVFLAVVAARAVALLFGCAGAGTRGGPGVARDRDPVPDVAGMTVPEAHLRLAGAGYGCAVVAEKDGGAGRRVVTAQRERPGSYDPHGDLVRLTVSKPYPGDARYPRDPDERLLPPNCADLRTGHGHVR